LTRDAGRPATTAEVDAVIQAMRRANWGPYKEMEQILADHAKRIAKPAGKQKEAPANA
jgi:hypothetical protein